MLPGDLGGLSFRDVSESSFRADIHRDINTFGVPNLLEPNLLTTKMTSYGMTYDFNCEQYLFLMTASNKALGQRQAKTDVNVRDWRRRVWCIYTAFQGFIIQEIVNMFCLPKLMPWRSCSTFSGFVRFPFFLSQHLAKEKPGPADERVSNERSEGHNHHVNVIDPADLASFDYNNSSTIEAYLPCYHCFQSSNAGWSIAS